MRGLQTMRSAALRCARIGATPCQLELLGARRMLQSSALEQAKDDSALSPHMDVSSKGGSTFESYTDTSSKYDETRRPLGVSTILGAFASSPWPLSQQHLVDIGGGTGTFVSQVHNKFGQTTLFEYDPGMLKKAEARLKPFGIECIKGSADDLGCFKSGSVHAVTTNHVVHHFPSDQDFAFFRRYVKEVFRVLAPGGAFVLQTSSSEQYRDGYWWFKLMPKATEAYCAASPPLKTCMEAMSEAGFQLDEGEIITPLCGTLMSPETYLTAGLESAFSNDYRDGDSAFAMAEKTGEMELVYSTIRQIQHEQKEAEWLEERELARKRVGQATFIIARKSVE